ncbi:DUF3850 domain-containing protein [Pseudomonas sp. S1(2024)]|uniref:DUF3850 domain-containing protein n=1 Tax=Pseudomonas sp. S1(2024) TaxID=3390191 RepID=UPI00397A0963
MTTHRVKLPKMAFFDLLSGAKNAELRDCSDTAPHRYRVGDTMHFNLVDETGNPTPHEITRTITHVEYDGQLDDLCLVCYAPVPKKYDLDAVKNPAEQAAFSQWASQEQHPLDDAQRESARVGWLAALEWMSQSPGIMETQALHRAATIVRRGKQHNRGARGIDSHLEKAAQRIEKRADFEWYFYDYVHPTPAKPQMVCLINTEDAKFLQSNLHRKGTFKMDLFLDEDSAGADTSLLYIIPAPVHHAPLPVDCEADRPVFSQKFPEAARYKLREDGLYWDEGGLRDEPFPAGPNSEWKGWKACYEHHVLPMSTEIARLKIHHRNEYVEAYREQEALGNGV